METTPSTSISLLDRVCRDDPEAWRQLVELYGPVVFGWARSRGLGSEDSADVTQDVFLSVARSIASFHRIDRGAFRGWLWTIARSKWNDQYRRMADQPPARGGSTALQQLYAAAGDPDDAPPPTEQEQQSFYHRAIGLLQSRFDTQTWRAFWRTAVDGVSPDQVADELGMSRWAVYKARSRVLHRLRSELAGLDEAR